MRYTSSLRVQLGGSPSLDTEPRGRSTVMPPSMEVPGTSSARVNGTAGKAKEKKQVTIMKVDLQGTSCGQAVKTFNRFLTVILELCPKNDGLCVRRVTHTAPASITMPSLPGLTETSSSPGVTTTPSSPWVTTTPSSPGVTTTPSSPWVTTTPSSPGVTASRSSPTVINTPSSPGFTGTQSSLGVTATPSSHGVTATPSSPDITATRSSPTVSNTPSSPWVTTTPSSPWVTTTPSSPGVTATLSSPTVINTPSSPGVTGTQSSLGVTATPSSHGGTNTRSLHGVTTSRSSPTVINTPSSPGVTATSSSPGVTATPSSPGVTATPSSSGVPATRSSPTVSNTPSSPGVTATQSSYGGTDTLSSPTVINTQSSPGVTATQSSHGGRSTWSSPTVINTPLSPAVTATQSSHGGNATWSSPTVINTPSTPGVSATQSLHGGTTTPSSPGVNAIPSLSGDTASQSLPSIATISSPGVTTTPSSPGISITPSSQGDFATLLSSRVTATQSSPEVTATPSSPGITITPSSLGDSATLLSSRVTANQSSPEVTATPSSPGITITPSSRGDFVTSLSSRVTATPSSPEVTATPSSPGITITPSSLGDSATSLSSRVTASQSSPEVTATPSSPVVTITPSTHGVSSDGLTLAPSSPMVTATSSSPRLTTTTSSNLSTAASLSLNLNYDQSLDQKIGTTAGPTSSYDLMDGSLPDLTVAFSPDLKAASSDDLTPVSSHDIKAASSPDLTAAFSPDLTAASSLDLTPVSSTGLTSSTEPVSPKRKPAKTGDSLQLVGAVSRVEVKVGERAELYCGIRGTSPMAASWVKNRKQVEDSPRISVHTCDTESRLLIHQVCEEDGGCYTLCVHDRTGSSQHHTNLAVVDHPSPPFGKPMISALQPTSLTLSWSGPCYDGGSAVLKYWVEMKRIGQEAAQDWKLLTDNCVNTSYHVDQGLELGGLYQFRVRAVNAHGVSEAGEESDAVTMTCFGDVESEESLEYTEVSINTREKVSDLYIQMEKLGVGKFGQVYKLQDRSSGRIRAGKFFKTLTQKEREIAKAEVELMNKLHHPRLVQCVAAFQEPGRLVLVLEYVAGGELFERIVADDFDHTEITCAQYVSQILAGVGYMHQQSIVHLDLKPENIVCVNESSTLLKIIDFGLARQLDPRIPVKVLQGTVEFVAPEVIAYEPVWFTTDMWSLGVICYILVSGDSPFQGSTDMETLQNITAVRWEFDEEMDELLSIQAKDFIKQLLQKDKRSRLTSSQALDHPWLQDREVANAKALSKERMKKFLARQKWLKTGKAMLALKRMALLSNRAETNGASGHTHEEGNSLEVFNLLQEQLQGPPSFSSPLKDQVEVSGSSACFQCHIEGFPDPEVLWFFSGSPIQESRRFRIEYEDTGSCALIISNVSSDDSGVYTCRALNAFGQVEVSAKLTVHTLHAARWQKQDTQMAG